MAVQIPARSSNAVSTTDTGGPIVRVGPFSPKPTLGIMEPPTTPSPRPDVTTHRLVQRRQSMFSLRLKPTEPAEPAETNGDVPPALEEVQRITDVKSLQTLCTTVRSQPGTLKHVRELHVNLRMCWGRTAEGPRSKICRALYQVLHMATGLRLLSLDLEECADCWRTIGSENFAADGANFGYDLFFSLVANRIRNELHIDNRSGTLLPELEEFRFTSTDTPYAHCAFFALPSLRRIISVRDTGAWPMILEPEWDMETLNSHIEELTLESSALVPTDVYIISKSFPNLKKFTARSAPTEANRQYDPDALTESKVTEQHLSAALTRLPELRELRLELHHPKTSGIAEINFPLQLGPAGGITILGGLFNLTDLTIGMHHLLCHRSNNGSNGTNSQHEVQPLLPTSLPPNLKRVQLFTCFDCCDNRIADLSRQVGQQILPSYAGESTFTFVESLAAHVSTTTGLPHLKEVRLYSQMAWWRASGRDYRTVKHCTEENGQIWNAGCLEERCGISRFENRTPGIHFRAYVTDEFDCERRHPREV